MDTQPTSATNLFIGNLTPDVLTDQLKEMFEPFGDIESCRVMVDSATQTSRGFGFVKFRTPDQASYAIHCMNNSSSKEGSKLLVKFANATEDEQIPTNNVYVKGLPTTVGSEAIKSLFSPYGMVTESKILTDSTTQQSRGQALIRFADVEAAARAISALNNYKYPGTSKGILVKFADTDQAKTDRRQRVQRKMIAQTRYSPYGYPPPPGYYPPPGEHVPYPAYLPPPPPAYHSHSHHSHSPPSPVPAAAPAGDPNNLYVYHLPADADDALLYRLFAPYGAIQSVKIGRDQASGACKGFGFVRMMNHTDAWTAVNSVNGQKCGAKTLSVTFKK
jgi:ELAV like protein 2/3/4